MRQELDRIRTPLEAAGVPWAVAAGMAVYLYTANRAPTDLDILVRPDQLQLAGELLGSLPERHETPWGESLKIDLGRTEIAGDLNIRVGAQSYRYAMDQEMVEHIRMLPLQEIQVPTLAPEDLVALKAVLQRGPEQGKHDLEDLEAMANSLEIDSAYLAFRLRKMGAIDRATLVVRRWGWLADS